MVDVFRWLLYVHVALVLAVGAFVGLSGLAGAEGADVGRGLALLALGALGVPWTLPVLLHGTVVLDSTLLVASAAVSAVFNVGIHVAVARRRRAE